MHEQAPTTGTRYRSLMATLGATPSFDRIGSPLERVRRELWVLGEEMAQMLDPGERATVTETLRTLQTQICRIAVIGQVKAGKSTFLSALIGRPNLLPSDVNPWTTVVTSLHYTPAEVALERADFAFFGADEWDKIANGGGLLRELTERLVPGFNPELLRLQLDTMRRRAEQRLGAQFRSLLGNRHQYDTITHELLDRYVAAGPDVPPPGSEAGRYSDLTKSADLYFYGPRTGFPICLIDTPGTNDPLLVRDEITRLSLASADIYIVVLTAQQPLSANDVALLRILRGLHKERVVVFINRIDQLRNPAVDGQRLLAHVRTRLNQEFPASHIPIILGSAWWGSCALSQTNADLVGAANEPFRAYAESLWNGGAEANGEMPARPDDLRQSLQLCSGIPSVLRALDQLMLRGSDAHAIRQLAAFLLELARSAETAARAEMRVHEKLAQPEATAAPGTGHGIDQWRAELDQLTKAAQEIEEVINVFKSTLEKTVNQCLADLRAGLLGCIARFADIQLAGLTEAYHSQSARIWTADASALRDDIERAYLYFAHQASAKLRNVEMIVRDHLATLLKAGVLEGLIEIGPTNAGGPAPLPNLAPISTVLSLDLDQPWWKAWLVSRPTLESRRAELKQLIDSECMAMARGLLDLAAQSLHTQAGTMTQQMTAVTLDVVNSMRRRSLALVPDLQQDATGAAAREQGRNEQAQIVDAARARGLAWEGLRGRLADLSERCAKLVQDSVLPTS